jgi:alpha-tubulin suppressor-like RCC1 family protein
VGVTQVTAGDYHSCALLSDGRVECWGRNNFGQLGNGEAGLDQFTHRPTPVKELDNVLAIDAGGAHTCAILKDKKVKCWGDNSSPVLVPDLLNVQQLALGFEFSCAISGNETLCWGKNDKKQVGVIGASVIYNPTKLFNGPANPVQLTAGNAHACLLTAPPEPKTYCWGSGEFKQHGQDTFESMYAGPVPNVPAFKSIAAGDKHTCAVSTIGGVVCWGHNNNGQLGLGYAGSELNPPQFWEFPNYTDFNKSITDKNPKMTMGNEFSCQVIDGSVECVGYAPGLRLGNGKPWVDGTTFFTDILKVVEQIGDQPNVNLPNPTLTGIVMADSGQYHSCALKNNGAVYCWGGNPYGQAGTHLGLDPFSSPGLWAVPVVW